MGLRRVSAILAGASGAWLLGATSPAEGADKASLVCIQAAEAGQTARHDASLVHARELFRRCSARDCPAVLRRDCTTWLDETDRQIPSVVIGAHDAQDHDVLEAAASVDGVRALDRLDGTAMDLDPGPHVIVVELAGSPPVELRVVLRAGEKNRPILASFPALHPAPPPPTPAPSPAPTTTAPAPPAAAPGSRGVPLGAYLLGAVGLAGFGVLTYFGLRGDHDADVLHGTCAPGCSAAQVDSARRELQIADVGLGVGVVGVVAATWIAVRGLTRSNATAWSAVVAPTAAGAQVGATVRF